MGDPDHRPSVYPVRWHGDEYDRLLLATGGYASIPPIERATSAACSRCARWRTRWPFATFASGGQQAAVIGGGLLGLEAARSLHALGLEVTVIEFFPRLLPRQLDAQGQRFSRAWSRVWGCAC